MYGNYFKESQSYSYKFIHLTNILSSWKELSVAQRGMSM